MSGFWRALAQFFALTRRQKCLIFVLTSLTLPAEAATGQRFDLPAQPLGAALISLATEADVSIGLSGVTLTGKTARALSGHTNFEDALAFLLAGSGLGFEKVDSSTYRIFEVWAAKDFRNGGEIVPLLLPAIEELTITAAKRPEVLQSAAISATVVKGTPLSDYGLRSSSDAASLVAGLSSTHQTSGANKYFLRGLSDGAFTGNTQSAVGVYIDETRAVFNAPDPNLRLVDVERVEVIRGPQGTLYGAGSIGGLVRIITKPPVFGTLESEVSVDGNLGASYSGSGGAEAMLNLPLGDALALRGVIYGRHDAGYIDNSRLKEHNVNTTETTGGRLTARTQLSQDWTVGAGVIWQSLRAQDSQYYDRAMPTFSRGNRLHEPRDNEFLDFNLTVNGDLGWAELVSSTAWISQHVDTTLDASLALPFLLRIPEEPTLYGKNSRYRTINHETRLISAPDTRLQWLAGAFYSRRRDAAASRLILLSGGRSGIFYSKNRHDSGTEMAIFGEMTYAITKRLSLTGGLRAYRGLLYATADNSELIDVGPTEAVGKNVKNGATPKATLSYRLTPDDLLYAEAAQGFRLGGINIDSRVTNPTVPRRGPPLTVRNFDSDTLWNFELGSKSTFFDQKLNLNAAVFYAVWNNMQADLARPNGLLYTTNIGRVHNAGFEIESIIVPNEHFRAFANIAWSSPDLTESNAALALASANRLPVMPKFSASIAGQYQRQIAPRYEGYINLKYDIIGSARLTNSASAMAMTSEYQVFNARAGVIHQGWKMSIYVDNIFNTASNTYAFGNPFSFSRIAQVTPLRPRTIGLTATYSN